MSVFDDVKKPQKEIGIEPISLRNFVRKVGQFVLWLMQVKLALIL